MTDPRVRRATPADADALAAAERECLGADAWSRALVEQGLTGSDTWLVAEVGGDLAGYAVVGAVAGTADLHRNGVLPAYRRRGVAHVLLAEAVAVAAGTGADRVLLEVREDNRPALALYAAHGGVSVARRERYYADGTAALVLRLPPDGGRNRRPGIGDTALTESPRTAPRGR